jgi:ubiquinone/menaquinone biosynthesis C-methylase UbiE
MEKLVSTVDWYDFVAVAADLAPEVHVGGFAATRELLAMVDLGAHCQVLDVGCGAGHTACWIAQEYGAHVVGIDLSEGMLAQARRLAQKEGLGERVQFKLGDIRQMPFAEGTFDVAVFQSVLTPFAGAPAEALRIVDVSKPAAPTEAGL